MVAHVVDVFSRYGVIFLLFLIGLDNTVEDMKSVGGSAVRVGAVGVLLPFLLGIAAIKVIAPDLSANTDIFVGASLAATSVGITASVLQELGKQDSQEGKIILGAAVMDDVLGLLILSIISGIVVSGQVELLNVVNDEVYSAVVLVVIVTTLLAPPCLKSAAKRGFLN